MMLLTMFDAAQSGTRPVMQLLHQALIRERRGTYSWLASYHFTRLAARSAGCNSICLVQSSLSAHALYVHSLIDKQQLAAAVDG